MQKVLGLVLAVERAENMSVLTHYRPKSALPFGGLYRFIDFAMSNFMHSNINRVGILFQYRSVSLIKHIGTGDAWDMIGGNREVIMLPPMRKPQQSQWYRGTADAVCQTVCYRERPHRIKEPINVVGWNPPVEAEQQGQPIRKKHDGGVV